MKNALTNAANKKDKKRKEAIIETLQECRRLGIKFLPLDINKSMWEFTIEDNMLRVGFSAAKGLGRVAYENLEEHRPYSSMEEVISGVAPNKFNKTAFMVSIFGGAFNEIEGSMVEAYEKYKIIKRIEDTDEIKISKDIKFKSSASEQEIEEALFETAIISDPVQGFEYFNFNELKNKSRCTLQAVIRTVNKRKDKNGNQMAIMTLETSAGHINSFVFSTQYKGNTKYMKKNKVVSIEAIKDKDSLIIQKFVA